MTFNANSVGITVTDTNNTTVFSTTNDMPHIIGTVQGTVTLDHVVGEAYPQYVSSCSVLAHRIAFNSSSEPVVFSVTTADPNGINKPIDLTGGQFFPQLFIKLSGAVGQGIVPGINGRWMMVSGGMLIRAFAGNTNLRNQSSNPAVNSLCGAETLDCIINPEWKVLEIAELFWINGSNVVTSYNPSLNLTYYYKPGDQIGTFSENNGTATQTPLQALYTVASVTSNQVTLTAPYSGATRTEYGIWYARNILKIIRLFACDGVYGRTSSLGTQGLWGVTYPSAQPCSYFSGGQYVGPFPWQSGNVIGTNYTLDFKLLLCKR